MTIKEMRERAQMSRDEFSEYFGIPKRTIENWEGGQSKCPEYLRKLIEYKLRNEELLFNVKYTYRWTDNYNQAEPDNNFSAMTESIVCARGFTFEDYLKDCLEVNCECIDGDMYYLLDCDGEPTGSVYWVTKEELTEEELRN